MRGVRARLMAAVMAVLAVGGGAEAQEAQPRVIPDGYPVETIDIPDHIALEVGGLDFRP